MGNGGASVTPTSALFGLNQSIAVNATPAEGYQFSKWQDPNGLLENSFSASTSVVMSRATGNSFIQAQFERKQYDVQISSGSGGNIIFDTPNGPWIHFLEFMLSRRFQILVINSYPGTEIKNQSIPYL